MRWTERQQAMLREMGLRLWLPPDVELAPAAPARGAAADAGLAAPAERRAIAGAEVPSAQNVAAGAAALAHGAADVAPRALAPSTDRPAVTWAALIEEAAGCTACALSAGRSRSVFGSGHLEADWLIVGDAPGEEDDGAGEPFAGAEGQLLENMLNAIGLTRREAAASRQAYVAHSVKCRPPGNRLPEANEAESCSRFLRAQLRLVQPRVVLAMGRVAARSLVGGDQAFARLRGQVHRCDGVAVVVTYSPSHLLRHAEDKAGAWEDLCLAADLVREALPG